MASDLMYGGGNGGGSGSTSDKLDLGVDSQDETRFITWFRKMEPKSDDTVRLFDRGEFYTAHGDDATKVAKIAYKTLSVLKQLGRGKETLPSVTLNISMARAFLREALTAKQLKVEIWSGGTSKKHSWQIEKFASPGNLQQLEDLLFADADLDTSPIVVALRTRVQDGVKTVGAAFADASNRQLGVAEYAENDLFANTESLLIQIGAKECLIPADESCTDFDINKLKTVINRAGCVLTQCKRSDFQPKAIEQDVTRLLKEDLQSEQIPELNLKIAMGSMQALLSFLSLLNDDTNFGQYNIYTHDLAQFLRVDHPALRAMGVFNDPGQTGASKNASLYGLLNRCKTPQGQRLLAQWLKQPLVNVHEIQNRHTLVETFVEDSASRENLQNDFLRFMPDLQRNSKRFQKGVATLEDVVNAYQAVLRLDGLIDTLSQVQGFGVIEGEKLIQSTFIEPLQRSSKLLAKLVEMVETTIDLAELDRHRFVIKPDFDDRLRNIRDSIDQTIENLHEEYNKVKRDLKMDEKKVKLEDSQQHGYCFRVTRNDSKALKEKSSKYIELGTTKAGVWFTTRQAKDLSVDHIDLQNKYSTHQSGLVKQVIKIAAGYCPPLEQFNAIIANLDVIVSFAFVSSHAPIPYVRPQIFEMGKNAPMIVKEARHPCLEVQDDLNFIPNDAEMVPDESEFLVITGPNMGGKSTYIRSIGIIALMSQAGCFVPCAPGAKVPVFDAILARVGAGDNQTKGVSTFMAEMLETSTILRLATRDSLIIIDELGRGTSTYDGFGLAWSISEFIASKIRSKCLFASHFAEIVALADQIKHVQNLHCKVHVEPRHDSQALEKESEITLLYKVEPGICDRSYGIHVAELAGFPPSVIKLAKRKAEEMEDVDGEISPLLTVDAKTTEEGMKIIEEFMRAFASNKRMRSDGTEAESLSSLVAEYRERCGENAFVQKVLESL
ncbi:putative DNA mismatch repair protein MSH2 [Meira miltonrushii]|uniref:DNA mismatch repair protein MSH2 n=1 Tax=Meira miltonrushii TaxID=1280837 RepID=A0A316VA05_9BASI|nr:putative DNA mismatch repair protein MSH2 [Meira miltonrushii]PWN32325.1 putative DNA mismatch repair protein MSH2 [Meira miltonrushii]